LDKEKINIVPSLQITLKQLISEFEEKNINVELIIPNELVMAVHQQ
jgi:hypothetical protein